MARKARFYRVTFADGNGSWIEIHPAQSKAVLQIEAPAPHVKLVRIEALGWYDVKPDVGEADDLTFRATIGERELVIEQGHFGHGYLQQQFALQAKKVVDFLERDGEP